MVLLFLNGGLLAAVASRAEGKARGRECLLESSRIPPPRISPPRPEAWLEEEEEEEEEVEHEEDEEEEEEAEEDEGEAVAGGLGTDREPQSASGRLGGVGGCLSRDAGSPGAWGKGLLPRRPSAAAPAEWGRSGGGGGGRSLSAGGGGRGLSLWWVAACRGGGATRRVLE